jgi:hypothetical protein
VASGTTDPAAGLAQQLSQSGMKNLMDIAVVEHADALGESCKPANYRKVDELPFDFVRRACR